MTNDKTGSNRNPLASKKSRQLQSSVKGIDIVLNPDHVPVKYPTTPRHHILLSPFVTNFFASRGTNNGKALENETLAGEILYSFLPALQDNDDASPDIYLPLIANDGQPCSSSSSSFVSASPSTRCPDASETPETDVKDSRGTPITGKKDVNPIKIDAEIRKCIEKPFTADGVQKLKKGIKGQIYLDKNHQNLPGRVYQIAVTEKPTNQRKSQHQSQCRNSFE
ncbi:hypothetical protein Vi05172_g12958 [Venturia inaequalis]|uniref:Uncharacterized protein n=1 Tax=Venturia inaequalis TaxID=5025 RepID=A0A8H3VNB0_VENIN|nr:hypothetical protein EG327_001947 [Venturia inaequalis]RDI77034.1 hypothetical protein Vi05172_g12958 [Venturia inaequalis]